jgi:predicted dithiol-disulfide oxidoreductase (DUF899 family)
MIWRAFAGLLSRGAVSRGFAAIKEVVVALPEVVSREEWLQARVRLLAEEKEPWYSSFGSDFNYDFGVTLDKAAGAVSYNYRPEADLAGGAEPAELPGASCFLRDGDEIFHTYSAYARGLDHVDFAYAFLDLTALGRQEAWEEPKDRTPVVQDTL